MTLILLITAVALALFLGLTTLIQTLYMESMRLRTREPQALEYFREHVEDRIGLSIERGALTFSLIKHTTLLMLGAVSFALNAGPIPIWQSILEALLLSWLVMMTMGYLVPHLLYRRTSGRWLPALIPIFVTCAVVARPLTWLMEFLESLAQIAEPAEESREKNGSGSEDIEALIDAGTEEGLIEEDDRKLIQSVVAFGDKTVREVMTPRPNMVAIEADHSLNDLRQLVINEQYSRIPVYEGDIDHMIGCVHVRDMFELDEKARGTLKIRDLLREIHRVPETKPVDDLLREMQEDGTHMSVVIDEYGNTAGLATMEDLVEVIVGEIRDEHEPDTDLQLQADGSYIVAGSFDVDHLANLIDFRPNAELESTTVGGLVTEWAGRVPQPGERIERDGIRLEVLAGNEFRVDRVRISRLSQIP
ncbi:MAG: hemolysin family protein [Acidobacteria bacterium]|nr:hemolysin family protein [Acidobacteriota bacterium]